MTSRGLCSSLAGSGLLSKYRHIAVSDNDIFPVGNVSLYPEADSDPS